ncbi:MAG: hypothetical protein IKI45_04105 [Oscillospiraceae bacterium]|nr:hypothetical protein [Oscillospiraceae bacterium]
MKKHRRRSAVPPELAHKNRLTIIVWSVLRLLVIGVAVRSVFMQQWERFFTCLLTLILFMAPSFVERRLHIKLPTALEITVLIFIFCAEVLGEIACFYIKYPLWDTMLHTVNGFLFAAFGFCLVDLLNENRSIKFRLSPNFLALVAFCFSMTIGIFWEFFEFTMDHLFALDMQKDTVLAAFQSVTLDETRQNIPVAVQDITRTVIETADGAKYVIDGYLDIGLTDTLKDLFVNFIGAAVFSLLGRIYVRQRGKNSIAAAFIPIVSPSAAETESTEGLSQYGTQEYESELEG